MDFLLTRFLAASSMNGKLAEAEKIEWRVWYFLHSRKWMNCLVAVGLSRSVSHAVVKIIHKRHAAARAAQRSHLSRSEPTRGNARAG